MQYTAGQTSSHAGPACRFPAQTTQRSAAAAFLSFVPLTNTAGSTLSLPPPPPLSPPLPPAGPPRPLPHPGGVLRGNQVAVFHWCPKVYSSGVHGVLVAVSWTLIMKEGRQARSSEELCLNSGVCNANYCPVHFTPTHISETAREAALVSDGSVVPCSLATGVLRGAEPC